MSPRTVRDTVPPHVETAVMRALAKLPADRFATAKEFANALDGRSNAVASADAMGRPSGATFPGRRVLPWLVAGALGLGLLLGGGAALQWRTSHTVRAESVRFTVEPPAGLSIYEGTTERRFALSADGRSLLFAAGPQRALYLRRLNQLAATLVPGVERPIDFQFSADGESIAYTLAGSTISLRKVRAGGGEGTGAVTLLADIEVALFAWTHGSDIVYILRSGLWRMPSGGGTPSRIVARDTTDGFWVEPVLLEEGRTVAFREQPRGGGAVPGHLRLVPRDGGDIVKSDLELINAIGYRDGFLIYGARDGRVNGVKLDLKSGAVSGEPLVLLENVASRAFFGPSAMLGTNGTLAYMTGESTTRVDIVDERGATILTLPLERRRLMSAKWSPDGGRVLIQTGYSGQGDAWVYDLATRVTTRLTQSGNVGVLRWAPDGKRVAFMLSGTPVWMPADGSAPPEPIAALADRKLAFDFSRDGRYALVYTLPRDPRATSPLVAIPIAGGAPIPLLAGVTRPSSPRTSPDGRWMVYSSEEGERPEVYVRPFPSGPGRLQVSANGGDSPSWSRDGRRIFYRAPGAYRVATVDVSGTVPRLVRDDSLFADVERKAFDVHPDGKRFAILRDAGEKARLVVVTHWLDEALAKLRHH